MNEATQNFRLALIQNLNTGGFDVDRLRQECDVPDADVTPSLEAVFEELCLRASTDGDVTAAELETLSRCGALLRLSEEDQTRILTSAKKRVISDYVRQARADGVMTIEEQEALFELRDSLGLP